MIIGMPPPSNKLYYFPNVPDMGQYTVAEYAKNMAERIATRVNNQGAPDDKYSRTATSEDFDSDLDESMQELGRGLQEALAPHDIALLEFSPEGALIGLPPPKTPPATVDDKEPTKNVPATQEPYWEIDGDNKEEESPIDNLLFFLPNPVGYEKLPPQQYISTMVNHAEERAKAPEAPDNQNSKRATEKQKNKLTQRGGYCGIGGNGHPSAAMHGVNTLSKVVGWGTANNICDWLAQDFGAIGHLISGALKSGARAAEEAKKSAQTKANPTQSATAKQPTQKDVQ